MVFIFMPRPAAKFGGSNFCLTRNLYVMGGCAVMRGPLFFYFYFFFSLLKSIELLVYLAYLVFPVRQICRPIAHFCRVGRMVICTKHLTL